MSGMDTHGKAMGVMMELTLEDGIGPMVGMLQDTVAHGAGGMKLWSIPMIPSGDLTHHPILLGDQVMTLSRSGNF